jgi:hypothetical protein
MRPDGSGAPRDGSAEVNTGIEAGLQDGGATDASPPDASPDSGPPDVSCPPLQATGDQITDTTTHLSWSRLPQAPTTHADATTVCTKWGGRLPTETELVAFVGTASAAIVPCTGPLSPPFPPDPGSPMWTTTMDSSNPNFFITVYYTGLTTSHPSDDGVWYICVKP